MSQTKNRSTYTKRVNSKPDYFIESHELKIQEKSKEVQKVLSRKTAKAEEKIICWACNKVCKFKRSKSWKAKSGWVARPIRLNGKAHTTEIYCKECFEQYGWPDVKDYLYVE